MSKASEMKVVLEDLSQMEVIIESNPGDVTKDDDVTSAEHAKERQPAAALASVVKTRPEFFDCDHCDFRTRNKGSLKRHVDTIHLNPRQFECAECQYKASQKCNLEKHVRTVHMRLKPFPCNKCSYAATQRGDLEKHIDSVHWGLRQFPCDKCEYQATQKEHLRHHINSVHHKLKPFPCTMCDYRATTKTNLKRHVGCQHENPKKRPSGNPGDASPEAKQNGHPANTSAKKRKIEHSETAVEKQRQSGHPGEMQSKKEPKKSNAKIVSRGLAEIISNPIQSGHRVAMPRSECRAENRSDNVAPDQEVDDIGYAHTEHMASSNIEISEANVDDDAQESIIRKKARSRHHGEMRSKKEPNMKNPKIIETGHFKGCSIASLSGHSVAEESHAKHVICSENDVRVIDVLEAKDALSGRLESADIEIVDVKADDEDDDALDSIAVAYACPKCNFDATDLAVLNRHVDAVHGANLYV